MNGCTERPQDPLMALLSVEDTAVTGQAHVCYASEEGGGTCWWPAEVRRAADGHGFEAAFSFGPPAAFNHAADEFVAATPSVTAFLQRHPRAIVVFTLDSRTGAREKWLYHDGHECFMAFAMAFNNHQTFRMRTQRILPEPEMRGRMLRRLAEEQQSSTGLWVSYASQAPPTAVPPPPARETRVAV